MAVHRVELRLKGVAAVGFIYFGRADAWALGGPYHFCHLAGS